MGQVPYKIIKQRGQLKILEGVSRVVKPGYFLDFMNIIKQ